MPDTQIAIVGGGPVGLTLALFLARAGVQVTVLERDAEINRSPRAMVYLNTVLPELDEIGLLDEMKNRGVVDREGLTLHVPATGEVIRVSNEALDGVSSHPFNIHLGQGDFCQIATEKLALLPNVRVVRGADVVAVAQDAEEVRVDYIAEGAGETLTARYLVGADGARSAVRTAIGAELVGTTWPDRFVATNVRFDFRSRGFGSSNMYVDPEIGCIVAEITADGLWRCTYQEPGDLDEATVAERIPAFYARLLGRDAVVDVVDYRPYRIHQRRASALHDGRIVLAGDAAHLTNPTGGLGLTTGLTDVYLLQEALIAILQNGADEGVLALYARARAKVFDEFTSPSAVQFKTMVYDTGADHVEAVVAPLRAAAAVTEGQRAVLLGLGAVRSPSLRRSLNPPHRAESPAVTIRRGSFWIPGEPVPTPFGTVQRGPLFVEWEAPETVTKPFPLVLVHGGGGQMTDWRVTADGRPGWVDRFVADGYAVYLVDRPGHGRSPHHPAVLGEPGLPAGYESATAVFMTPQLADAHTQWPWRRTPDGDEMQQFVASSGFIAADFAAASELEAERLAQLLDITGEAVLVTHSLGANAGWLAANRRPGVIAAIVAIEPLGPPFVKVPGIGELAWGITAIPVTTEPPTHSPEGLGGPASPRIIGLDVPVAVLTAPASPLSPAGPAMVEFLTAVGARAELIRLEDRGIDGNGHGVMMEANSDEAIVPVLEWLAQNVSSGTAAAPAQAMAPMA
ncbi:FAD-dependent oxidoreductase [Microbacterium sp. BWT-G7]|uniref:FAD-dependent oxidoreductase n=2 Tax=Microbacterium allomyrinae TaxID=2830666 RepID=A0A9X1S462_9MICO|nr:FAD-dependent oxidoreductase [Microbacterium allomyrinae]